MSIMYKKNKELLKKIYMEEYGKAELLEQKAALNREMERIKAKAKADAKRKYAPKKVKIQKAKVGIKKRAKPIKKALKRYSDNMQRANKEILGFDF